MEFGSIEREIDVDAAPEIVYEVVSRPEHLRQWWPDDADYELVPGTPGQIVFGMHGDGPSIVGFEVVDAQPPHTFSFRWTQAPGVAAEHGNSLLVTFELRPSGAGTRLKMTETGFREMGWNAAVLEQQYNEHVHGWSFFLPRLAPYAESVSISR